MCEQTHLRCNLHALHVAAIDYANGCAVTTRGPPPIIPMLDCRQSWLFNAYSHVQKAMGAGLLDARACLSPKWRAFGAIAGL